MAGDWIKVEKALLTKPKVKRIAEGLDITIPEVVGRLLAVWCWVDDNSLNGRYVKGATLADVDTISGRNGLADLLLSCGWCAQTQHGLRFPHLDRYIGKSAKKRALTYRRVKRFRNGKALARETDIRDRDRDRDRDRERPPKPPANGGPKVRFPAEQIETVYQAYPKRVAKREALKAIRKALAEVAARESTDDYIRENPVPWMLEQVKLYAKARQGQDKQFTPHPASWFNAGHYDDDPKEWLSADAVKSRAAQDTARRLVEETTAHFAAEAKEQRHIQQQRRKVFTYIEGLTPAQREAEKQATLEAQTPHWRQRWAKADPTKNHLLALAMYQRKESNDHKC